MVDFTTPNSPVAASIRGQDRLYDFWWVRLMSVLGLEVLPAKEPSINGPRPGTNHCSCAAERCQDYRNPRIARVGHRDPELNYCDQCSHDRGPKADQQKYRQTCTNDLRNHRWREGCTREINDPEANKQEGGQNSLKQKSYPWPAVGESRKESLQNTLRLEGKEIATKSKRLKAGGADPTFGGDPVR